MIESFIYVVFDVACNETVEYLFVPYPPQLETEITPTTELFLYFFLDFLTTFSQYIGICSFLFIFFNCDISKIVPSVIPKAGSDLVWAFYLLLVAFTFISISVFFLIKTWIYSTLSQYRELNGYTATNWFHPIYTIYMMYF